MGSAGDAAPTGGPAVPRRRRDLRVCLLLAATCLLVYNANLRLIATGDSLPARYQPLILWRHGTLLLDPMLHAIGEDHPGAYWIVEGRAGHAVSLYPVVLPVLLAPLYAPAVVYLDRHGWEPVRLRHVAAAMEKLSATLLAAAAAAVMYLLLRRRAPPAAALLLAAAFAFGTDTWMIGSQALWQHGLAELLLAAALLLLTGPYTPARALAVGLLCGLIAGNRPPDALLAGALGLYALHWAGRRGVAWLAAGAVAPLCLVMAYNLEATGMLIGGYGIPDHETVPFFRNGLLSGIAGLLVSPARGLLVFSPFLVLVPAGLRRTLRDPRLRWLALGCVIAMTIQILFYAKADWRGGKTWGPRWLTDLLPILVWMLPPAYAALRGAGRALFAAAVGIAIAIQAVGAFWYIGTSDRAIFAVPKGAPGEMRAAWDPRNTPFLAELRHHRAPFQLPFHGGDSPAELNAARVRKAALYGARQGAGAAGPAGTDGAAGAGGAAEGSRSAPGGELSLAESAQLAAARIRGDQQKAGFWITRHTRLRYYSDTRHAEMNTYLTAMILDLLAPVAQQADLGPALGWARAHLTAQIEADGLVRYHGRPDAPTIPALGCVITPDSDDTALVWRLAMPGYRDAHRDQLRAALATLAQYRRPDGLYRTWLAPRSRYQCLDPGADPNPPDIGIQMHLLLFFAQADPPAAAALCGALQRSAGDERLWVYYREAPLVPLLRQADLLAAGCRLQLPAERLRTPFYNQQDWLDTARLLTTLRGSAAPASPGTAPQAAAGAIALLHRLAQDRFSAVRLDPPLLYHNDLSAHTPRFYWSEDFGYALWLRLYLENERRQGSGAHP